jgi:solute carrier family 25 phosphate transporter 3
MEPDLLRILGKRPKRLPCDRTNPALQTQGAFKYGGYEFFKKFYSDLVGEKTAYNNKTALYLTASASAEFIADIFLCPFEAVKVRMQTTIPPFAKGTFHGISTITAKEGTAG